MSFKWKLHGIVGEKRCMSFRNVDCQLNIGYSWGRQAVCCILVLEPLFHPKKSSESKNHQGIHVITKSDVFLGHMAQVQTCDNCTSTKEKPSWGREGCLLFNMHVHNRLPFFKHPSVGVTNLLGSHFPYELQALLSTCQFNFTCNWSFLLMVHMVNWTDDQYEIISPLPSLVHHSKPPPSHMWDPLSTYPLVKWV